MAQDDGRERGAAAAAAALILTGLALRLWVAAQPVERLLPVCLADDAFYYLRIAENILAGHGPCFDGETATNGYHPLWMLASLAAVRLGGGAIGGARFLLTLLALIGAANALQIWRLARRTLGPLAGVWAAGFWALSPLTLFTELMGVEAPLMVFFALTATLAYLPLRSGDEAPLRAWAKVGGWLGLAMLARTDALLFGFALAIDVLAARWLPAWLNAPLLRRRVGEALSAMGVALLVVSPWALYSLARFGTVTQDSYRALMYAQRAAAAVDGGSLAQALRGELAKGFYDFFMRYLSLPSGPWALAFAGLLGGAALGARLTARDRIVPRESGGLRFVLLWGALAWAFYVFWFWQQKQWYFLPVHLFLALGTAALAAFLRRRILHPGAARLLVGVAAATMLAGFAQEGAAHWRSGFHPWQTTYLAVAAELRAQAAATPGLRAGAFNSGVLSAFSGLPVVNLDGVVNPEAARATRERRLLDYLRERRIELLADHRELIAFYGAIAGGDWPASFMLVRSFPAATSAGDVLLLRLRPRDAAP